MTHGSAVSVPAEENSAVSEKVAGRARGGHGGRDRGGEYMAVVVVAADVVLLVVSFLQS